LVILHEFFHGTVVTFLGRRAKKTGGELAAPTVVSDTFATDTLPRTGLITTIAIFEILLLIPAILHCGYSSLIFLSGGVS